MGDLSWRFDDRERYYINEVLDSGFASSTAGNMNARLEKAFSERFCRKYAITFNSGTTTLHSALWALGVRYGDEVIVTPLTVISCMNSILYCNAIPVFADIDPETYLINPDSIKEKINERTKAILVVHLYGQVCNMTEIMKISSDYNLPVVEDCAQCYLGKHRGKIGGTFGQIGSWSFENSKHITTGDGGIVALDDEQLGDTIRRLNCQGFRNATALNGKIRVSKDIFQNPMYKRHSQYGFMYRLPEIAAAMGLGQIEKIDMFVNLRREMAVLYSQSIGKCNWLKVQKVDDEDYHSYYTFAVRYLRDDISWEIFRKKYVENGGDGVYAAWALSYQEDSIDDIRSNLKLLNINDRFNTSPGICPIAEKIQPQLMQFTTNQKNIDEMHKQADVLYKTIRYFS